MSPATEGPRPLTNDEQKKRRYSEDEFALILRKASEIQLSEKGSPGGATTGGLTLDEIRGLEPLRSIGENLVLELGLLQ